MSFLSLREDPIVDWHPFEFLQRVLCELMTRNPDCTASVIGGPVPVLRAFDLTENTFLDFTLNGIAGVENSQAIVELLMAVPVKVIELIRDIKLVLDREQLVMSSGGMLSSYAVYLLCLRYFIQFGLLQKRGPKQWRTVRRQDAKGHAHLHVKWQTYTVEWPAAVEWVWWPETIEKYRLETLMRSMYYFLDELPDVSCAITLFGSLGVPYHPGLYDLLDVNSDGMFNNVIHSFLRDTKNQDIWRKTLPRAWNDLRYKYQTFPEWYYHNLDCELSVPQGYYVRVLRTIWEANNYPGDGHWFENKIVVLLYFNSWMEAKKATIKLRGRMLCYHNFDDRYSPDKMPALTWPTLRETPSGGAGHTPPSEEAEQASSMTREKTEQTPAVTADDWEEVDGEWVIMETPQGETKVPKMVKRVAARAVTQTFFAPVITSEEVEQAPSSEEVEQTPFSEEVEQTPFSEEVEQTPSSEKVEQTPFSEEVEQTPSSEEVEQTPPFITEEMEQILRARYWINDTQTGNWKEYYRSIQHALEQSQAKEVPVHEGEWRIITVRMCRARENRLTLPSMRLIIDSKGTTADFQVIIKPKGQGTFQKARGTCTMSIKGIEVPEGICEGSVLVGHQQARFQHSFAQLTTCILSDSWLFSDFLDGPYVTLRLKVTLKEPCPLASPDHRAGSSDAPEASGSTTPKPTF